MSRVWFARFGLEVGPLVVAGGLVVSLSACGDDGRGATTADAGAGAGGRDAASSAPSGGVSDALLAACPAATTLIESTEWPTCLAGTTLSGTEPFGERPCALQIGDDGALVYTRDGQPALSVPTRDAWRAPTGTYQNQGSGPTRLFLAGVAPDLAPVEGEPRVLNVDISIFGIPSESDVVAVRYLDAALVRREYTCMLDGP